MLPGCASLEESRRELDAADPIGRLATFFSYADGELLAATLEDFRPAVPTTNEGLLCGVLGFILGWSSFVCPPGLIGAGAKCSNGVMPDRGGNRNIVGAVAFGSPEFHHLRRDRHVHFDAQRIILRHAPRPLFAEKKLTKVLPKKQYDG